MAGLGESCSHVAALLFAMDTVVRVREGTTCTSVACGWLAPSSSQIVPYAEAHEIDFASPNAKMRRLNGDVSIRGVRSRRPVEDKVNYDAFYSQLHASGSKSVVLSLLPDYGDAFIPKAATLDLPQPLSTLYDPDNQLLSEEELRAKASEIFASLKITDEQIITIERETRDQVKSDTWFRYRSGRVTASIFKSASRTKPENPSVSLIQRICYPMKNKFANKATRWGCDHEVKVRDDYMTYSSSKHQNFRVEESGMFIHKDYPWIGASPDGLVTCSCCGDGLLEVKCPFCHKDSTIGDAIEDRNFCMETVNGVTKLKLHHSYHYQVQCQLAVTKRAFCDFSVWTGKELAIQRILPDPHFFDDILSQVTVFYKLCILPELLAKQYTRQKDSAPQTQTQCENREPCVCKTVDPTKTLMYCAADDCEIRVFHKECFGLKNKRKGWKCTTCRAIAKRKKTSKV